MDTIQQPKRSEAKKSFNMEGDVARLWRNWKAANPNVIESRIINQALREKLQAFKRATRKEMAA